MAMSLFRTQKTTFSLFKSALSALSVKPYSKSVTPVKESDVKKSVFISQSQDVYSNLALEDWLYRNYDFTQHHVLMLSRNAPSVVIGKHQNPWLETNFSSLSENGLPVARRTTDGDAFYNDLGNLNLTFFSPGDRYNKKYNMEIIVRGIFRKYGLKVNVSSTEDLTLRNYKRVSGNASKVGQSNSYHQCTLLIQTNKVDFDQSLQKQENKRAIMNLCEENPRVTVEGVLEAIGWEYMRTSAFSLKDEGLSFANHQNGFQMVNPTDSWFPGLAQIKERLCSWEWRYGITPNFTVSHSFHNNPDLNVFLNIAEGKIENASVNSSEFRGLVKDLIGSKYSLDTMEKLESFVSRERRHQMTSL